MLWDITKGRIEHAEDTLRIAAKMNGVIFNEPVLKTFEIKLIENEKNENTSEVQKKLSKNISKMMAFWICSQSYAFLFNIFCLIVMNNFLSCINPTWTNDFIAFSKTAKNFQFYLNFAHLIG